MMILTKPYSACLMNFLNCLIKLVYANNENVRCNSFYKNFQSKHAIGAYLSALLFLKVLEWQQRRLNGICSHQKYYLVSKDVLL